MNQNNIKHSLGQVLLLARRRMKLNQQEVAGAIGISRAALSYYEKGERSVDIGVLYKLCKFYDISLDCLFGLRESPLPSDVLDNVIAIMNIGMSADTLSTIRQSPSIVGIINDVCNLAISKNDNQEVL